MGQSAGNTVAMTGENAAALTGPTVIHVVLAMAPSVAGAAVAVVASMCVLAGGPVATRAFHTLVDVDLACLACKGSTVQP